MMRNASPPKRPPAEAGFVRLDENSHFSQFSHFCVEIGLIGVPVGARLSWSYEFQ
jgi:hypothetical protein